MNTALLIIDVQNIMFTYNNGVYLAEETLDNIYELLIKARESNIPVIFIKHSDNPDDEGKDDWEIHTKIEPLSNEKVIIKHTWDSFYNTSLNQELKNQNINKLVIVGMQSEFCVDTTCRRAFSLGYESVLVSDGHSTFDSEILSGVQIVKHHNNIIGGRFAQLVKTCDVDFK